MAVSVPIASRALDLVELGGGLLTTALAEREGLTRLHLSRLARRGILERVHHGIYAVPGTHDPHRHLRAAWLALAPSQFPEHRLDDPIPTGVLSHTSAAAVHDLGDLLDDVPEITVSSRTQTRRGTRFHRADLAHEDVMIVDLLPVTTPERTVADLLRDGHDESHVVDIVRAGVERGIIDRDELARRLETVDATRSGADRANGVQRLLDLAGVSERAVAAAVSASPIGDRIRAETFATLLRTIGAMAPHDSMASIPESSLPPGLAETIRTHVPAVPTSPAMLDAVQEMSAATISAMTSKIDPATTAAMSALRRHLEAIAAEASAQPAARRPGNRDQDENDGTA